MELFRNKKHKRGLKEIINRLPDGFTMIELGSALGESTEVFIEKASKIYCIDSWSSKRCEDKTGIPAEEEFDKRFKDNPKIVKIKKYTNSAVNDVPEVDFVYIDACHYYDSVKKDIINYKPKAKIAIGGHDYTYAFKDDVIKAVAEEFDRPDYVFSDGSWFVIL